MSKKHNEENTVNFSVISGGSRIAVDQKESNNPNQNVEPNTKPDGAVGGDMPKSNEIDGSDAAKYIAISDNVTYVELDETYEELDENNIPRCPDASEASEVIPESRNIETVPLQSHRRKWIVLTSMAVVFVLISVAGTTYLINRTSVQLSNINASNGDNDRCRHYHNTDLTTILKIIETKQPTTIITLPREYPNYQIAPACDDIWVPMGDYILVLKDGQIHDKIIFHDVWPHVVYYYNNHSILLGSPDGLYVANISGKIIETLTVTEVTDIDGENETVIVFFTEHRDTTVQCTEKYIFTGEKWEKVNEHVVDDIDLVQYSPKNYDYVLSTLLHHSFTYVLSYGYFSVYNGSGDLTTKKCWMFSSGCNVTIPYWYHKIIPSILVKFCGKDTHGNVALCFEKQFNRILTFSLNDGKFKKYEINALRHQILDIIVDNKGIIWLLIHDPKSKLKYLYGYSVDV